ncbi:MAG: hypothetical protein ABL866_12275 [Devosia sp.]
MIRAIAVLTTLFVASPALATEWVHCASAGGEASFDYLAGDGLGVLSVVGLNVSVGEQVWASDVAYGPGEPVSIGQQFEDADTVRIDAMGGDLSKLAELRLFKASEADAYARGGTLRIAGHGAWAVGCEGP